MKKLLLSLIGISAVAGLYLWSEGGKEHVARSAGRPAAAVTLWQVQRGEFVDEVAALGNLRAWESVTITASVAERVTAVHFDDGDSVDSSATLVTLQQDEEQAALRELQEALLEAEREVRRLQNLARQNQVAQTELDAMRTRAAIARHKIDGMRARIADRTIIAPFAGVLGLREVSPGALVNPGQKITTLDDTSRMRLDFTVPATLLGFMQTGQEISANSPTYQREFQGRLSAIDSRVDALTRSITARATLANPDGLLKPGMLMEVTLRGERREVLLLPEESLQSRATEHYVWVVDGDTARRTVVTIGARKPGWLELTGGISEGAPVVRDGVGKLRGTEAAVRVVER